MNILGVLKRIGIRLGIGLLDLAILATGLIYIYLGTSPTGGLRLFAGDALIIFLIVVVLYIIVVGVASLLLTTMRQDSFLANMGKTVVSIIIVVALFSWILVPSLWVFGYDLSANVDIRNTLIIISVIRSIIKVWAGRRFAGGQPTNE